MELTATAFRKNLFKALDQALDGERVEITYRGHQFQLVADAGTSKFARMVKRDIFLVDPLSIVESDSELMQELDAKWKDDRLP